LQMDNRSVGGRFVAAEVYGRLMHSLQFMPTALARASRRTRV
jgi:hypothetical protein